MSQTLGELLKNLRVAQGWKLQDVVAQFGERGWSTSTSAVSRFENNHRTPSIEYLSQLLELNEADASTRALATRLPVEKVESAP